jgi:transketolase
LLVVEEHVSQGGVASMIAKTLLERGLGPERFASRSAGPYAPGRYGSQKFHRRECGLDPAAIVDFLISESA